MAMIYQLILFALCISSSSAEGIRMNDSVPSDDGAVPEILLKTDDTNDTNNTDVTAAGASLNHSRSSCLHSPGPLPFGPIIGEAAATKPTIVATAPTEPSTVDDGPTEPTIIETTPAEKITVTSTESIRRHAETQQ
ncbi:hypothetical protein HYE68_008668 [Fusarium pseudograminearum]|nr:hypothetical protein HYE68_008668 [Fusarium pseudograminearum]